MIFTTAQEAFEHYYHVISQTGFRSNDTKCLYNQGFLITDPKDNIINTSYRKWNKEYADEEWEWYLSKDRSVTEIKKLAKLWDTMHNGDDIVNSNYGYQWNRNGQLDRMIEELRTNPTSRRAVITIYDGKEHEEHALDTPCTLNIIFNITKFNLNMSVLMRSNDLWFGFCNDQYCFSKLQAHVASKLNMDIGWYYHYAHDLHIYDKHLHKN